MDKINTNLKQGSQFMETLMENCFPPCSLCELLLECGPGREVEAEALQEEHVGRRHVLAHQVLHHEAPLLGLAPNQILEVKLIAVMSSFHM